MSTKKKGEKKLKGKKLKFFEIYRVKDENNKNNKINNLQRREVRNLLEREIVHFYLFGIGISRLDGTAQLLS